MNDEFETIATSVLYLMKKSIKRMFILLIIFIVLLVLSVVDSIYQRCRIIDLLEDFEVVEETDIDGEVDEVVEEILNKKKRTSKK